MTTPEITVTAEPAQLPPPVRATLLAHMGEKDAEVWMLTVTCPHGQFIAPATLKLNPNPTPEFAALSYAERHHIAVATLCQRVREEHLRMATCPCSHPWTYQHGPMLASGLGLPAPMALHDEPCRN